MAKKMYVLRVKHTQQNVDSAAVLRASRKPESLKKWVPEVWATLPNWPGYVSHTDPNVYPFYFIEEIPYVT